MRIVVTGASGYLGGRLVRALAEADDAVFAIVRESSDVGALESLLGAERIHTFAGDADALASWIARARPDAAMHLAAHQDLSDDIAALGPLVDANVRFAAIFAASCAAAGVGAFIDTGTFSRHALGTAAYAPASPYAATKEAFSAILAYYRQTTPMRALTLELTDVYGPDDPRPKVFNLLAEATAASPLGLSPGEQLLSLVHADDVVAAYRVAARRLLEGAPHGAVHSVAASELVTLRDAVAVWERATGGEAHIVWGARPYRPREIMRPYLAERLPGWGPSIPLAEGFARVYGASRDT